MSILFLNLLFTFSFFQTVWTFTLATSLEPKSWSSFSRPWSQSGISTPRSSSRTMPTVTFTTTSSPSALKWFPSAKTTLSFFLQNWRIPWEESARSASCKELLISCISLTPTPVNVRNRHHQNPTSNLWANHFCFFSCWNRRSHLFQRAFLESGSSSAVCGIHRHEHRSCTRAWTQEICRAGGRFQKGKKDLENNIHVCHVLRSK